MFRVIDEETQKRVLEEALKGERPVPEIAEESGVSDFTIRNWLNRHYAENPDDPRRHLMTKTGTRYAPDPVTGLAQYIEESDADAEELTDEAVEALQADEPRGSEEAPPVDADDQSARDDMTKKNAKRTDYTDEQRKAVYALLAEGQLTHKQIGEKTSVNSATVSFWARKRLVDDARGKELAKARQAVLADFKHGYVGNQLLKRHKKVTKSTIYKWIAEYRAEREEQAERNRESLAKAREARLTRLRTDPEYREQQRQTNHRNRAREETGQLPLGTDTAVDAPLAQPSELPPPAGAIVEYRAEYAPNPHATRDMLRECIEERQTLRGMVDLLQREQAALKKTVESYRLKFGELRGAQ